MKSRLGGDWGADFRDFDNGPGQTPLLVILQTIAAGRRSDYGQGVIFVADYFADGPGALLCKVLNRIASRAIMIIR